MRTATRWLVILWAGFGGLRVGFCAQETGAIIIVARCGKLRDVEVSPRSGSLVPALWRLALEGVTLARVEQAAGFSCLLEDLERTLVPEGASVAVLDAADGAGADGAGANNEDLPEAFKELHEVFRAPPRLAREDLGVLESLRRALGARAPLHQTATAPALAGAGFPPGQMAASGVTLVRCDAGGAGGGVEERDALLEGIVERAGEDAYVLVLSLPEEGPGTLVARGPRFKSGRVLEATRSVAVVRALVAALLEKDAAATVAGVKEERIDELFQ